MYIKFKYLLFAMFTIVFISCNEDEFLSEPDPNRITDSDFWKDENSIQTALATSYSALRGQIYGYWGAYRGFGDINSLGDDIFTITGESAHTWAVCSFINDENNEDTRELFAYFYQSIHRSNLILDRIVDLPIEEEKKIELIAETKFLRGLAYFYLAINYGSVPLRLHPVESTNDYSLDRSPLAKVWDLIIEDLTSAKTYLPIERNAEELGRATKGAAIGYLAKSYMFMEEYVKAEAEYELLMDSPFNYALVDEYEENFTEINEFNKESIFEWAFEPLGDPTMAWDEAKPTAPMYNYIAQFVGPVGAGGWFKYLPSNYLVNMFISEERPIGSPTRFDKRMYTTLFWKRSNFGEEDVKWYGGTQSFDDLWYSSLSKTVRLYPETPLDTISHGRFLFRKFTTAYKNLPSSDSYWEQTASTANYRVYRFAEVLLMHAEAAAHNGHLAKAIDGINKIRIRAGLSIKTSFELSNKEAIMKEIDNQKLLEFAFEQNRIFDLRRWYKEPSSLKSLFIARDKQGASNFSAKHYFFPIPLKELETNPVMRQNDLWK